MAFDASKLENIFRMMTPVDLLGAHKLTTGKALTSDVIRDLFDIFFRPSGALSTARLVAKLKDFLSGPTSTLSDEKRQEIARIVSIFANKGNANALETELGKAHAVATARTGTGPVNATLESIIGKEIAKDMAMVLINSGYLSPAVRNAERVELFMNFLPSIVPSRMVPLVDVEFQFKSFFEGDKSSVRTPPGLLRFLMGSTALEGQGPNITMARARITEAEESADGTSRTLTSTAGMEMFTSPQTLVNPSVEANKGRYVDVIDPFRPFMSIESFTVNITPTVGLFSYEKATLVLKLHDRSRLAEISDLLRPQIYQQAAMAPTVWVTYGWRHPNEPGNPYADFINSSMLVRKAYHIINTQFSFDQVGQVLINVELWTKGAVEMRTIRLDDGKPLEDLEKIRAIAQRVTDFNRKFGVGPAKGLNREIRGYQLIESAARGSFPDVDAQDANKTIEALEKSLNASSIDQAAVKVLIEDLKSLYEPGKADKKNFEYKEKIRRDAASRVREKFNAVMTSDDPFLPSPEKEKARKDQSKSAVPPPQHPFADLVAAYNDPKDISVVFTDVKVGYQKKLVSLGKLVSFFMGQVLDSISSVDEAQLFFYQFNDKAGKAASTNIAEFPIDMPVFLDQYREHVERKGTDGLTLDEFFRLLIDAQVNDTRAVGYGFRSYFEPYDLKAKHDAKLQKDKERLYENALAGLDGRGPFQKPVLEFYIETTYELKDREGEVSRDLLRQYELQATGGQSSNYTRIMRIHVFDKTNNPHKLASTILRGDEGGPAFIEVEGAADDFKRQLENLKEKTAAAFEEILKKALKADGTVDLEAGFSNQQIKQFVSRTVPSIIYGSNASTVISANLSSKHDPLMVTAQMQSVLKSGKGGAIQPNGSGPQGLPLRVIPASMTMTTLGCPLLEFGQLFFVDFNTGTTIDNIYNLTGVTHTLTPGRFESQLTLTFADAYMKFEGSRTLQQYAQTLEQMFKNAEAASKDAKGRQRR